VSDRCPCGGIILADTERWRTPLCHECWVPFTRMDVPKLLSDLAALRREIDEAPTVYGKYHGDRWFVSCHPDKVFTHTAKLVRIQPLKETP
jgi:hypothetical protein